ncbi:cytochrome P450 4V2-like isoform X1 [Paramuricea clavata]|nr:cytochrome P450 4V2-like isoform X1 [Paramuricea clavata]
MSVIPGPKAWPIIGNTFQIKRDPHEFLIQISGWAEEFRAEGICRIWLAQKPVVGLFKAEYVEVECMRINLNDTVITPNTR